MIVSPFGRANKPDCEIHTTWVDRNPVVLIIDQRLTTTDPFNWGVSELMNQPRGFVEPPATVPPNMLIERALVGRAGGLKCTGLLDIWTDCEDTGHNYATMGRDWRRS
jgi:hypothetical protein